MLVDYAYYTECCAGTASAEEFNQTEPIAEDVIGAMTHHQVTADTIDNLPSLFKTLYKKAICAQTNYFVLNGFDSAIGGSVGFTVGKVSVNNGASASSASSLAASVSPLARMYLEQTGLMNPQVATAPDMPLGWWG